MLTTILIIAAIIFALLALAIRAVSVGKVR